jgi:flagellar basal-body rod modification protein FlgD
MSTPVSSEGFDWSSIGLRSTAGKHAAATANDVHGKNKKELGQQDFMRLMLEQLKAQDPMDPQDNGEFISQMAQFSQLDGMTKLNQSFDNVANSIRSTQALQASALVGHSVMIPSTSANLEQGKNVKGSVVLTDNSHNVNVSIKNSVGETVKRIRIGDYSAGTVPFEWDGTDNNGNKLPNGKYEVVAEGSVGGKNGRFATMVGLNVDSVSLGGGTVLLNIKGHGSVNITDVREIS